VAAGTRSRHRPRSPVEDRLLQLNVDSDILLIRAQAIHTAGRRLNTEAKEETSSRKAAAAGVASTRCG